VERVTKWRVLVRIIGIINSLVTHSVLVTLKYGAIADLHTLQFTVAHALGLSVFHLSSLSNRSSFRNCHFRALQILHMKSSSHTLHPRSATSCILLYSWFHFVSHFMTDGQSASLSWHKAPIWGLRPDMYYWLTVTVSFLCSVLSDERTGLSFVYAAGPYQRILSRVRVSWDSRPYFNVWDLRLPFSSPPKTPEVTAEVLDPASTRFTFLLSRCRRLRLQRLAGYLL
jgi:hypothetical protein